MTKEKIKESLIKNGHYFEASISEVVLESLEKEFNESEEVLFFICLTSSQLILTNCFIYLFYKKELKMKLSLQDDLTLTYYDMLRADYGIINFMTDVFKSFDMKLQHATINKIIEILKPYTKIKVKRQLDDRSLEHPIISGFGFTFIFVSLALLPFFGILSIPFFCTGVILCALSYL